MLLCIGLSNSLTARPFAGSTSRSHAIARTSSLSLSAADDSLYASLRSRLAAPALGPGAASRRAPRATLAASAVLAALPWFLQ